MAAGLGSRYGGEKQVEGLGPQGQAIMEYSVFDAIRAGFEKVVFIIKPHMIDTVKNLCGDKLSQMKTQSGEAIKVHYVFQDFSSVPSFYTIPSERVKPFGTIHAALCAKDVVSEPFALINADDYYGKEAYETILAELMALPEKGKATMVGYKLSNTVSDNGTVTRGVCVQEGHALVAMKETFKIKKYEDGSIADTEDENNPVPLSPDTLVSMNFWGFTPWIFEEMEAYFHAFLKSLSPEELKAECLLPLLVDQLIHKNEMTVSVLSSAAKWFGVTYREDREIVVNALAKLHHEGIYPENLWAN